MPKISVILPVYNGAQYLAASIQSILDQEYKDFELIIINDGSKDDSQQVIEQFTDPRIRAIEQKNKGLAATLNVGLELAKGEYIARQDQDDLARSDRFTRQLAFLEEHPDYGAVGTWASVIEEHGPTYRYLRHPLDNGTLRFSLLFNNPFVHSSMMMRRSVLESVGGYSTDPKRQPPEDYELWSRLARASKVANLPLFLQQYRATAGGMSRDSNNPYTEPVIRLSIENMSEVCGSQFDEKTIKQLAILAQRTLGAQQPIALAKLRRCFDELVVMARQWPDTDQMSLNVEARQIWYTIASHYPMPAPLHWYYWLVKRVQYRLAHMSKKEMR